MKISQSISPTPGGGLASPIMLSAFLAEEHSRGKVAGNGLHLPPLPKGKQSPSSNGGGENDSFTSLNLPFSKLARGMNNVHHRPVLNYASNQFKVGHLLVGNEPNEVMFSTIDESRLSKGKQQMVSEVEASIAGQIVK